MYLVVRVRGTVPPRAVTGLATVSVSPIPTALVWTAFTVAVICPSAAMVAGTTVKVGCVSY